MARRGAAIEIEATDDALRLLSRGRVLTIANAARPEEGEDADFLVRLDEIEFWDAPDAATPVALDELQKICEAIEAFAEKRGFSVAFE